MKINVTEDDIASAGGDGGSCPVARAATRALDHPAWVTVMDISIMEEGVYGPTEKVIAPLPPAVSGLIKRYDYEKKMEPFEFEVDYDAKAGKSRKTRQGKKAKK